MKQIKKLMNRRMRRARRARANIYGVALRPRLAVFRSNRGFSAQLVDDSRGHTLVAVSSLELKDVKTGSKTDLAARLGEMLAKRAREAHITKAVFDRRAYAFHGRVKAFAEAARKAGLKF